MPKTAAEKQKAYRDRKREHIIKATLAGNAPTPSAVTRVTTERNGNASQDLVNRDYEGIVKDMSGPLSVYSPEHWARLQAEGFEWVSHRRIAGKAAGPNMVEVGATVPGDPAYQGVA